MKVTLISSIERPPQGGVGDVSRQRGAVPSVVAARAVFPVHAHEHLASERAFAAAILQVEPQGIDHLHKHIIYTN